MASEWELVALEDLANDITVGFVGSMASEYKDSGVPFLRTLNLNPLRIVQGDLKFISPEFHARIKKSALSTGDVVIARTGKPGTCAVIPDWLPDANCSDLVIVRCGPRINNHFLAYYVNTIAGHHIAAHTVGAVQQHFNVGSARQMKIHLPPLPVQEEIVRTLGALDNKIALLRETNTTLEAISQALFKSWFVDFDPVRAKAEGRDPEGVPPEVADLFSSEFEESELGAIPKGWFISTVAEVSERIFSGGTPDTRKPEFWNGPYPWFSSGETRNAVVVETEKTITKLGVEESSTKMVLPGDILVASAGQGWTRGQTSYCMMDTFINQSVVAIRAGRLKCSPSWLYFNLARRYDEMRAISDSHSIRGSLTTKLLGSMKLCMPPPGLGSAYSAIAESTIIKRAENQRLLSILGSLRDTLLPRLVSGKLSIPDLYQALEAGE